MSVCVCKLVKTIQVYLIWCILFYLRSVRSFMKWLSIFVIPVKENNYCASDWLALLSRTFLRYLLSSYYRAEYKYSKNSLSQLRICKMVSLHLIFVAEDKKTKFISNPFSWSNCNDCYAFIWACVTNHLPLFENLLRTVWLYSSMWFRLKWVGSDKLW